MILLHWPQVTMMILMILSVGYALAKDGEPKPSDEKYSFVSQVFWKAVSAAILYYGGFWTGGQQ